MEPDEPSGYENEPREYFQPLPPELYARFYHIERHSQNLKDELDYYQRLLGPHSPVLELGCGTGVIATALLNSGIYVVGLDLCRHMLVHQDRYTQVPLVVMDMRRLGFHRVFQAAYIAHNSLNLLVTEDAICSCLNELKRVLLPGGRLLLDLYCAPASEMEQQGQCSLQFHIFDNSGGGKIIKETIRSRPPEARCLILEERYKIRHFSNQTKDANYCHTLRLASFTREQWLEIVSTAGFALDTVQNNFHKSQNLGETAASSDSSRLLVSALSR